MSQAVLNELLDIGQRYAPEYQGGLSNHLPMALVALQRLGAHGERLREFFDRYTPKLGLAPRRGQALADWRERLGHVDAYADLHETFRARVERDGAPALLRETLPLLWPGVGAAAFHGLIRTAYGVDQGHAGETTAGLAYWACRHLPIVAPTATLPPLHDPAAWVAAAIDTMGALRIEGGLIFERMREATRYEAFTHHAGRLPIDAGTLAALADFAAQRYVATRNFTVLHLVTGAHAIRLLLPFTDDHDAALRAYAAAFVAACIASGITLDTPARPAAPGEWQALAERAVASNDDHVIKLVYSCRAEAAVYGDGVRRHAAALALGARDL